MFYVRKWNWKKTKDKKNGSERKAEDEETDLREEVDVPGSWEGRAEKWQSRQLADAQEEQGQRDGGAEDEAEEEEREHERDQE